MNSYRIQSQLLQLSTQTQRSNVEKLTMEQARTLYPEEQDLAVFIELEEIFGSRSDAELCLALCNYDYDILQFTISRASLFHYNVKLLESLCEKFSKNVIKVLMYLQRFKDHPVKGAQTTHCKPALEMLGKFRGSGSAASIFLDKFHDDDSKAQEFIERFDSGEEAVLFISKFRGDAETAMSFLKRFSSVSKAVALVKTFSDDANKVRDCVEKFNDESAINELEQEFGGSFDFTLNFIGMFDNAREARNHFKKIAEKCDERADNFCGDNCKWIVDERTKTLFIRGNGKMKDYGWGWSNKPTTPWYDSYRNVTKVVISDGITTIGDYAFYGCTSLEAIIIPSCVTAIGEWAFSKCTSLASITIPKSATVIKSNAFNDCLSLDSVVMSDSVETIESSAFKNCSLSHSIEIPNSVTTIGNNAFEGCEFLSSITIPSSVTAIGYYAFGNCECLTAVTLPNKFRELKDSIFLQCRRLRSINWI